jgi:biopolymer transport protein ExbB
MFQLQTRLAEIAAHALVAAPASAAPVVPVAKSSLLDYINRGGPIGYIIILLSLVGMGLIIAQFVLIRRQRLAPDGQVEMLDQMLRSGRVGDAATYCTVEDNDSFLARVLGSAMQRCGRSSFGFLELRTALEEAGQHEVARLYRGTDAIGLIAAIAPMLGLLGTVVGMVGAFETIAVTEGTARPGQLAGSISVALVTTVQGLIVAIPCTAAYTYLRNRIDALASEIAQTIEILAAHIEHAGTAAPAAQRPIAQGPRPVAGPPPPPPTPPPPPPEKSRPARRLRHDADDRRRLPVDHLLHVHVAVLATHTHRDGPPPPARRGRGGHARDTRDRHRPLR